MVYKKIQNDIAKRQNILNQYILRDDVFSAKEVDRINDYCNSLDVNPATISSGKSKTKSDIRRSDVAFFSRNNKTSWIFDRLNFNIDDINEKFYNFDLNGYRSIQYSRYDSANLGKYDFHMDLSFKKANESEAELRKMSVVVMLSDPKTDFSGGEFQFNASSEHKASVINLKKGSILLFPSFLIHRVKEVTQGVRKTLVLWVVGPKFR